MSLQDTAAAPSQIPAPLTFEDAIRAIEIVRAGGNESYLKSDFYRRAFDKRVNVIRQEFDRSFNELYETAWSDKAQLSLFKEAIDFTIAMNTDKGAFSNAFLLWLQENPDWLLPAKHQINGEWKDYDLMRADMLEAFGQALVQKHRELGLDHPVSDQYRDGHAGYVTKDAEGKWVDLPEEKLIAMLRDPSVAPRIVMTSNHAIYDSEKDLTPVTDSVEVLAKACTGALEQMTTKEGKTETRLVPNDTFAFKPSDAADLTAKDAVLVSLSYTRENTYLNLAQLFRRLHDIRRHVDCPEKDDFTNISKASLMLAGSILKLIVQNPDAITISQKNGQSPQLFDDTQTLTVAENASGRLKHLILYGFSQGGNIMRDAMRFLVHELDRENVHTKEGSDKKAFLKEVLASLSVTVSALNEDRMGELYRKSGVNVALIGNENDTIAPPPSYDYSRLDPVFKVNGSNKYSGHTPTIMAEAIINDNRARSHLMCALAPLTGKSAVTLLDYDKESGGLKMEIGSSSRREEFEKAASPFIEALEQKGLQNIALSQPRVSDSGRSYYVLTADNLWNKDNFRHLKAAIEEAQGDAKHPLFFGFNANLALSKLNAIISKGDSLSSVEKALGAAFIEVNRPRPENTLAAQIAREGVVEELKPEREITS